MWERKLKERKFMMRLWKTTNNRTRIRRKQMTWEAQEARGFLLGSWKTVGILDLGCNYGSGNPGVEVFQCLGKKYLGRGIGRALMQQAISDMRRDGAACIETIPYPDVLMDGTTVPKSTLIKRYESYGFVKEGDIWRYRF